MIYEEFKGFLSKLVWKGIMVAHNLDRYARNVSNFVVWMKDAPPQIYNVAHSDFTNFD